MLKRIPVHRLRPGLYVHDLNCDWLDHSFARNRFLIKDQATVERIRALGEGGHRALVLDLGGVGFVDSQGAAKVTEIQRLADADGVALRLADVRPQVAGVVSVSGAGDLVGAIAHVLKNLGSIRAMVVHGLEGLDEISLCGPTQVAELRDGEVREYLIEPEPLGLRRCALVDLHGGSADQSAAIVRDVLQGSQGPARDVVLLNSGAALYVSGSADSVKNGMRLAAESIDSGNAKAALDRLIAVSQKAVP